MMVSTDDFSGHLLSFLLINPAKHNLTSVNRIRLNGFSTEISDPTDNRPIRTVKVKAIRYITLIHSSTHLLRVTSISTTTTPHPTIPSPNTLPQIRVMVATQTHRRLCTSRRRIPTKPTQLRNPCSSTIWYISRIHRPRSNSAKIVMSWHFCRHPQLLLHPIIAEQSFLHFCQVALGGGGGGCTMVT